MRASVPITVVAGPSVDVRALGPFAEGVEVLSLRAYLLATGASVTMRYAVCDAEPTVEAEVRGGDELSYGPIPLGLVSGAMEFSEFAVSRRMVSGSWIGVVFDTPAGSTLQGYITARWRVTPREQSQLLWRRPRRS